MLSTSWPVLTVLFTASISLYAIYAYAYLHSTIQLGMLNDNRKFDYRIKCSFSFSFVSHSIRDFSRNRSSTGWSICVQATDSVTNNSYSPVASQGNRAVGRSVVVAVSVGGGGAETLDCGQRHHFRGPTKLTEVIPPKMTFYVSHGRRW